MRSTLSQTSTDRLLVIARIQILDGNGSGFAFSRARGDLAAPRLKMARGLRCAAPC
jgi:hypothetical protein